MPFPVALAVGAAISALAAQQQAKQQQMAELNQASSSQSGGSGIEMKSALSKEMEAKAREASGGKDIAFRTGAQPEPWKQEWDRLMSSMPGQQESKISDAQKVADNDGVEQAPINLEGVAPTDDLDAVIDGLDVVQIPDPKDAGKVAEGIDTGGGMFKDMSTGDKMAMAASIASLLRGPGAPPPPSAGSGPGINMQPVSLRSMYGRR